MQRSLKKIFLKIQDLSNLSKGNVNCGYEQAWESDLDLNSSSTIRQTCGLFHFSEPQFANMYNGGNNKGFLIELGL